MQNTVLGPISTLPGFASASETGAAPRQVAENTLNRVQDGMRDTEHLALTKAACPILDETETAMPGRVSVHADGLWTDRNPWRSTGAAKISDAQATKRPEFGALFLGIIQNAVTQRHALILLHVT